jgi:hypothetical protein
MDIKSAFLNGFLDEKVYVKQPLGYKIDGQEGKVYRLNKTLYGLKQAPRVWYNKIDEYLNGEGLNMSPSEPTLYTQVNQEGKILIVWFYVDDWIDEFKTNMKGEF